ncbi:YgiQ family radical SAM protein [Anaerotignum sp. MSJ-24]|uniref:YgiQ family radical SAM protein n=1 Tax=Anaerotignum sp. MSJ-24 TaxID=2841521 RepID=UPI001C0FAEE4|nr:YgiQ family radical SAM protein [Anaerotignum sp. MSJ-24]MBU5464527.1 YgiQ family radical SAM protein [Anaerotignum sp. MSJ-24]
MPFLPVNKKEMLARGWDKPDFVYVCGDAYVDHSSFGAAIICRMLEHYGYKVCMLPQPDWHSTEDFMKFGEPRLAFLVSAGNIDSMVNHYTVAKKRRSKDVYSPGGEGGHRPDRATIVYCNKIREAYGKVPIVIGGIEASLRRLSHYDYWDNKVRRSILLDSGADLLLYGMGEHQIIELAEALDSGIPISEITYMRGTVYRTRDKERIGECIWLPSYEEVCNDKNKYCESFMHQYKNTDSITAKTLVEEYREGYVVQNPPSAPLETNELDEVYTLPFMRTYHPMYEKYGGIPAIEEIKFSIAANRGCFGNCNFCAIVFHQGRRVTARSDDSIVEEAKQMTEEKDFKGYIHDVGGPTANFMQPACEKQKKFGACRDRQCLFPEKCPNLVVDHKNYLRVLRKLRKLPKVKKVFIRSGIRYDYLIYDKDETFFNELCKYHISGQLRVAPEHVSDRVLEKMGKPSREVYDRFVKRFGEINKKCGLNQYCIPYLMSSHPGSDLRAAIELAEYLRDIGHMPEQVQDFYPTPGTLSTCMYYTETDPRTGKKVYVPKNPHEKAMQRALMQYRLPANYDIVKEALIKAHREDLIGYTPHCLIRPERPSAVKNVGKGKPNQHANTRTNEQNNKKNVQKKKTIRNVHKKSR